MGGPMELVAFTALPVELARATLDRVESDGPGAKITRVEVFEIYQRLHRALAEGRAANRALTFRQALAAVAGLARLRVDLFQRARFGALWHLVR